MLYSCQQKISLPFYEEFYKKCTPVFKNYNIGTLPKIKKNLKNVIILGKDKSNKRDNTGIVYKFNCKNCPASYVGETKRALKNRISEHINNKNKESVVFNHKRQFNPNHEFDWEKTQILDRESNYNKRIVSEMIHINCTKNTINKKEEDSHQIELFTLLECVYTV